jgi:hypothetical protein
LSPWLSGKVLTSGWLRGAKCDDFVPVRAEFGFSAGFGGDPVAVELQEVVRGGDQPPFG